MTSLSPKEFAALLVKASEIHEASWRDGVPNRFGSYAKDWRQCCQEAGASEAWAEIMAVLLFPGYSDVWDWAEGQLKEDKPNA